LGRSWASLGAVLEGLGAVLGQSGEHLGYLRHLGAILGPPFLSMPPSKKPVNQLRLLGSF